MTGPRRKARLRRGDEARVSSRRQVDRSATRQRINPARLKSESTCDARRCTVLCVAANSPCSKGLKLPGTAIAIGVSQADSLPPDSRYTGQQQPDPGGNDCLRKRGRGSQCVLRGGGGATEKRMSKKAGRMSGTKYRSFVTERREALTSPLSPSSSTDVKWKFEVDRYNDTYRVPADIGRATYRTGKGQRTAGTGRREEAGRNGLSLHREAHATG